MEYLKNVQYIEYIVGAIVLILGYIAWHNGKKKEVKMIVARIIQQLMEKAEDFFSSKEGEKKLEMVLEGYKEFVNSLPVISKMLINLFFSEKKVKKLIEELVPTVEKLLGNFKDNDFEFFKESVLKIFSENIEKNILEKGFDENKSILTKDEFVEFNRSLKEVSDDESLLKLYANLETNFKDETHARVGASFTKKFGK